MSNNTVLQFDKDYLDHKYGLIHFNFFVQYARMAGVEVELVPSNDKVFIAEEHLIFSCVINGQQVIFDYADHATRNWQHCYSGLPYFKFQTNRPLPENCLPLGPPMVGVKKKGTRGATMREYFNLRHNYDYMTGTKILCKQMPNGAAVERRNLVHEILQDFQDIDISYHDDQLDFWQKHQTCLAAVCVPGATNNMVDRGHMELIGLGVCTVSPRLDTVFAFDQLLESGVHYVQCKDDYSDLNQILQNLKQHPDHCKRIGANARKFYDKYYKPSRYWQWILENLQ